jgi:hypothetical protein
MQQAATIVAKTAAVAMAIIAAQLRRQAGAAARGELTTMRAAATAPNSPFYP